MTNDLRRAVRLLKISKPAFALAVLYGTLGLGSAVALSAVAAWLIARASQMPPVLTLTVAAVAVRTFGVSRPVLRYLERLASHRVALDGMAEIRVQTYRIVSRGNVASLKNLRRGDLLARTSSDVEELANVVVLSFLPAAVAASVGIGVVVFLTFFSPLIALIVALCQLAAGILGPYFTMRGAKISELSRRQSEIELAADALTSLDHASELQVAGRLPELQDRISRHERELSAASDRAALPAALGQGFDTLALLAAVIGAVVVGINALHAGQLNEVELAVVVLTPLAAFEATALLGPAAVQLVRSSAAASRILSLLDAAHGAPVTEPLSEDLDPAPAPAAPSGGRPASATLELRDVSAGWPDAETVISDISLTVPPRGSIAIVGPSGIGKTTLLATLAGFIPARSGQILLDGTEATRDELARMVAVTEEDAHIFHTSLLENLRVGNGSLTDEGATALLQRAGLGDWLAALPEGLHTVLGADGHTVSGGERRRILLARALGSNAPILVMDETAEHLDGPTADALIADLFATMKSEGRSVVLVTHRLTPLGAADEVIMLGGEGPAQIVDRGTHDELTQRNAHYRWLLEQEKEIV